MSSASYAAWAAFDVEKELERVDEAAQVEQQQQARQKQVLAKERVEDSASQGAQQSAEILAAQAAVAALKARKGRKKPGNGQPQSVKTLDNADGELDRAKRLQTHAALFSKKHELLQQIMEARRLGEAALHGKEREKEYSGAKKLFQTALEATQALERLSPELLKAEEAQTSLLGLAESSNQHEMGPPAEKREQNSESCKHEHKGGHACGKSCSHGDHPKKEKPIEVLPKANDLMAIITMFYKDVYMGIGTCDLEEGRLAAASEAFKEVLLRDDVHLSAWLQRGQTFERMAAPLLAMLHFNRVVTLIVTSLPAVLYPFPAFQLEISCHLNIASGCLEMQRNYTKALGHCEQVLHLERDHAVCHFRMGQLYHASHSYEKALQHFTTAKTLFSTASQEEHSQTLATIAKETDKCEFDRSQYDLGYLRSLSAQQTSRTTSE
ncbi:hypothetical protein BBJ28_00003946 [Nothophytophthora sp. Chile5]|nr:hypothetical protein BBJ28_00003946 [Nothophytophthora sp. Chile5]